MPHVDKLTIEGYKSIRVLRDFPLRPINVLIGSNGAGKSNFISFFRLLHELAEQRLQVAVQIEGGAEACLHLGAKVTRRLAATVSFKDNGYSFVLTPTADNRFVFSLELSVYQSTQRNLGSGQSEARLKDAIRQPGTSGSRYGINWHVYGALSRWTVYHFHDTSFTAGVRAQRPINDNELLRRDAENLAAFLLRLQQSDRSSYMAIRNVVRLVAPFFDDFHLRPAEIPELIQLEWRQTGSDYPFRASQLSDGTLRFICLATALLQPNTPSTMLFDEPELGLHPYALAVLGGLFREAAAKGTQIIVSTQSALLLNEFAPEDVIVVERHHGQSTFRRQDPASLSEWLSDYGLGDLWQKNLLGGRPTSEDAPVLAASQGD